MSDASHHPDLHIIEHAHTIEFIGTADVLQEVRLVMDSLSIPYTTPSKTHPVSLTCKSQYSALVQTQLALYWSENRKTRSKIIDITVSYNMLHMLFPVAFLLCIYLIQTNTLPFFPGMTQNQWFQIGGVRSVLSNEFHIYRCITAQFFHADPVHILGNILLGWCFIALLSQKISPGMAWFLSLLSGFTGNLCSSLIAPAHFLSIGFSAAVFGSAGVLATTSIQPKQQQHIFKKLLPIFSGLALLTFLGTAGERTDLSGHFFGFCSGLVFGAIPIFLKKRLKLPLTYQNNLGYVMTLMLFMSGWLCLFFYHIELIL